MEGTAITLTITAMELQTFKRFQNHWPELIIFLDSGVFDYKNGKAVIHRDGDGALRKIEIETTRFKC